ncbi:N-acetylglucosamine-6-phosphate deacetylase [[Mycoplasma] testudinis]|uniref:N-acetylglucosamine-6-phosphate deacetylase n=1 Tax=[Mycoplasma] testudinis TaxID=33924 RepID=UPI0004869C62|nr:N-acetylglucosamine-6-phosphate deacetylase [[Mycoplasma] testudinis]
MIIKNVTIVNHNETIKNGWIEIKDQKIVKVSSGTTTKQGIDGKKQKVFPGFIDPHTHGGYGYDFEMAKPETFNGFAKKVAGEGVTKYCQATVTQPDDVVMQAMASYKKWMETDNKKNQAQSKQLGCHIEGPFLSAEKKGAHKLDLLKKPSVSLFKKWQAASGNNIRFITYAPEKDANGEFADYLASQDILGSAGHSNCSCQEFFENAYKHKVRHVTHLFNGMSGVHQHQPGLAVSALITKDVLCELISDGQHVLPDVIKMIWMLKGADGICLITDASLPKGLPDGNYKLGPLDTVKKGMRSVLASDGSLAGSVATFDHCLRFFRSVVKPTDEQLVKVSSYNIAKQMKLLKKTGMIKKGLAADLVMLDKNYEVAMTVVDGIIAFQKK